MKKYLALSAIVMTVIFFSNCHSAKKAQTETVVPKMTYDHDIQATVSNYCSPCHIPAKGGNKKPFDTYEKVTANIDSMIARIELNPGQKGFMPFRGRQKLSDSTINIFKQWRATGMTK